ncbi:hypothetical protein BpHYR1_048318, partial [Brachionus plicatilis]
KSFLYSSSKIGENQCNKVCCTKLQIFVQFAFEIHNTKKIPPSSMVLILLSSSCSFLADLHISSISCECKSSPMSIRSFSLNTAASSLKALLVTCITWS